MLKKLYYKLPLQLQNYLNKAASKVSNNLEEEFIYSDIGKYYSLNVRDKIQIIQRIKYTLKKIDSATSLNVHLELGKKILSIDKNKKGSIVECGCYKGASSVSLSIFAKIVKKKLFIYDSFSGLPNDEDNIKKRNYPYFKLTGVYKTGMYTGELKEVENNLRFFGELDHCIIRKGFFNKSLKTHVEPIDFLFLDVDLVSSTKDCLLYLWKYINDQSYIYTDDACDIDVVKFWFDEKWWNENLNCSAPGYTGSGCGIPLDGKSSSLGFTIKNPDLENFKKAFFLK